MNVGGSWSLSKRRGNLPGGAWTNHPRERGGHRSSAARSSRTSRLMSAGRQHSYQSVGSAHAAVLAIYEHQNSQTVLEAMDFLALLLMHIPQRRPWWQRGSWCDRSVTDGAVRALVHGREMCEEPCYYLKNKWCTEENSNPQPPDS